MNTGSTVLALGRCEWCNGDRSTLPLGMCGLHAAAPDLFEICQAIDNSLPSLIDDYPPAGTSPRWRDIAVRLRAAIARAEGREP